MFGGVFLVQPAVFCMSSSYLNHLLLQAATSGHTIVVYEVCLSLRRLVQKYSSQLYLLGWELVYDTMAAIQQHIVQLAQVRSSMPCSAAVNY